MAQDLISRVEQKKQETRKRILETAEQMFIREGSYEQTTIRVLACKAGISVGAVYLHFSTKADILAALVSQLIDDISHYYDGLASGNATGAEKIEALLTFFDRLRKDETLRLYMHFSAINPVLFRDSHFASHIHAKVLQFCGYIADVIKEGLADGTLSSRMNPDLAAVTLIGMSFSFIGSMMAHVPLEMDSPYQYTPDDMFDCFKGFIRESFHITARPAVSSS